MRVSGAGETSARTGVPTERFREARHQLFMREVVAGFLSPTGDPLDDRPISILDAGGSGDYWQERELAADERFDISVLNLPDGAFGFGESQHRGIAEIAGDATRLTERFEPGRFDIVFSNSVLEHVGPLTAQTAMGHGIRTVANAYFVQTPNYYFPIEPHFMSPLCPPYLPEVVRRLGARISPRGGGDDWAKARHELDVIRLMSRRELRATFPDAELVAERFKGLTKSWMAVRRRR